MEGTKSFAGFTSPSITQFMCTLAPSPMHGAVNHSCMCTIVSAAMKHFVPTTLYDLVLVPGVDPGRLGAMPPQTAIFPIANNSVKRLITLKRQLCLPKVQLWIPPDWFSISTHKSGARTGFRKFWKSIGIDNAILPDLERFRERRIFKMAKEKFCIFV